MHAGVSGRANGSSEIPSSCTRHIFCPTEGSVATNWRIARGSAIHARLEAHVRPLQTPAPRARVLLPAHRARGIAGEMRREQTTALASARKARAKRPAPEGLFGEKAIWTSAFPSLTPQVRPPSCSSHRNASNARGCIEKDSVQIASLNVFGLWRQRPDLESNPPESGACGGALVPPENWVNEIPPRYTPSGVSSASHHAVRLTITSNHQVNSRSHIIERRILSQRHRMPSSL